MLRRLEAVRTLALVACVVVAHSALAGGLGGRVLDGGGSGVGGQEVRLWCDGAKGLEPCATAATQPDGAFGFSGLADGDYRLSVRTPAGAQAVYAERWHDADGDGRCAEEADVVTLASDAAVMLPDCVVVEGGSLGGVARSGAEPVAGLRVRIEATDHACAHGDTETGADGRFVVTGVAPGAYRLVVHDPEARYAVAVSEGVDVVAGGAIDTGDILLTDAAADPHEPNEDAAGYALLDVAALRADPEAALAVAGLLGPLAAADVDWFCLDAAAGDHYLLDVTAPMQVAGDTRPSPWVDPMLSLVDASGALLAQDDDGGAAPHGAVVDTGVLTPGRYAVVVSAYGDVGLDGAAQLGDLGPYALTVTMGNRPPLRTDSTGDLSPCAGLVVLDAAPTAFRARNVDDPDHDAVYVELQVAAYADASYDAPLISLAQADGTWVPQTPDAYETVVPVQPSSFAEDARYRVRVRSVDEHGNTRGWGFGGHACELGINGVNLPPPAPSILSPAPGARFPLNTVAVTVTALVGEDPEAGAPGTRLELGYCASQFDDLVDCAPPVDWPRVPATSGEAATFTLDVEPGDHIYVAVLVIDERDAVSTPASTDFSVAVDQDEGPPPCDHDDTFCLDVYEPVCGLDGKTYDNDCFASEAGVGIAHDGRCDMPSCQCTAASAPLLPLLLLALGLARRRRQRAAAPVP